MRKIISRPDPLQLPALPLPIHVRSVGYNEADCGWYERVPGRQKNFVQLFWCVEGTGEIVFEDRIVRLSPGEVCYHLPREEHYHRSVNPDSRWCYHWFTFDGPRAADFMISYGYPQTNLPAGECPVRLYVYLFPAQTADPVCAASRGSARGGTACPCGRENDGSREHDLVKRFIELAHEGFADPDVTIASLAEELGIHRDHAEPPLLPHDGALARDLSGSDPDAACALAAAGNGILRKGDRLCVRHGPCQLFLPSGPEAHRHDSDGVPETLHHGLTGGWNREKKRLMFPASRCILPEFIATPEKGKGRENEKKCCFSGIPSGWDTISLSANC